MPNIFKKIYHQKATIAAVVVSYNRPDLVIKTLEGINDGSLTPKHLVVVDNASTDHSTAVIREFAANKLKDTINFDLIELRQNTGGAGGFAVGIDRAAFHHNADLVWVMDDDTEPLGDSLQHLVESWQGYAPGLDIRPVFVASKVVWSDGRAHPMNTPRQRPKVSAKNIKRARKVNSIPVRSASFVSLLLDGQTVREQGLPVADYFLWNDDFEYSSRLARFGAGLLAPRSVVKHHTKKFGSARDDPGARFIWEVRNKIWMFRHSSSLTPKEKFLYSSVSVVRWLRVLVLSRHKKTLFKAAHRGVKEGLFRTPRTNAMVLGHIYSLSSKTGKTIASSVPDGTEKNAGQKDTNISGAVPEKFSVLISYYENDTVEKLSRALDSVTVGQTVAPHEIVLVQDGKVSMALEKFVKRYKKESKIGVKLVVLKKNQGLAKALDKGLEKTSYELVARMDSDDISTSARFEKQLAAISNGYDMVGGSLVEFITDNQGREIERAVRRMPSTHSEIVKTSHFRSPFNHPTVMYKKSVVEAAGGYQVLKLMEDYWLFTRMIAVGAKTMNIPEVLVKYRVDDGAYSRRGGVRMLVSEVRLQCRLLAEGYNRPQHFVRNIIIRGGYRLVPERFRKKMYKKTFLRS